MTKIDFKKDLASYQAKVGQFNIIEIPPRQYLMIDGQGDPNTNPDYQQSLQTLYPIAYALKFASKQDLDRDYTVMPLEGLWWADDMTTFTTNRDKSQWKYTLMIMQPDWIDQAMFQRAVDKAATKNTPAKLDQIRLETLSEGLCVQTLHRGSFDDEGPTLDYMHQQFIPQHNLKLAGKHHEIYLSDFRRVPAEKLRTILRQPVVDQQ